MVVAPPPDFNLLLSTDKILELEPSLRSSKLFRALSIDTSKYSFDTDEAEDDSKLDKTLVEEIDDRQPLDNNNSITNTQQNKQNYDTYEKFERSQSKNTVQTPDSYHDTEIATLKSNHDARMIDEKRSTSGTTIQIPKSHPSLQPFNPMKPFPRYNPIIQNGGDSDFSSEESLLSISQHQQSDTFDFELKRRSVCVGFGVGSSPEFSMHSNHNTRESKFLSKSLTNLNFRQHLQTHQQLSTPVKTMTELFSLKSSINRTSTSSASNLMGVDERQVNNKPKTPSLFRRFSLKKDENTNPRQQQSCLNVPQVKIQHEDSTTSCGSGSTSKGGIFRNLSFKSSAANNNRLNPGNDNEGVVSSGLKPSSSQGRNFPVLRSPFSRAKFDKEVSVDERKKVYMEMLKSIREGDCRRLKLLLKRRRTDINSFEHDTSLIHESAFKGCEKCVKLLIKVGWSMDLPDEAGWRPLHAAVFGQSLDMVKCLLTKGADPNTLTKAGLSPLHLAVYNNDLYITHELFQQGADPLIHSHTTEEGTPFQLAINLKNTLVLDYFLLQSSFLV